MKTAKVLTAMAFAVASVSLIAQQAGTPDQQQSAPPPAAQANGAPSTPTAAPVEMSAVSGELVDKLDSTTAKAGDSIAIKTKSTVKTTDGTEIPKGSKLMGHVTGVKPSGQGNENSQVSLEFDRAELKGGQTVAIRSELESLSPAGSGESSSGGTTAAGSPSPSSTPSTPGSGTSGSPTGSAGATSTPAPAPTQPQTTTAPAAGAPAAGTVVARTGNIAIRTTSIPGVLLASNEPGQQDPRMANSSGILLGAKRDIQLDGGTNVVIGVAAAGGN